MSTEASQGLEVTLTAEISRMYEAVATSPDQEFHFYSGRVAAERYGYPADALEAMPPGAIASFAGVGNPLERARFRSGERVVDLGSGAGLDALVAARAVGPSGRVMGVELNPVMLEKARAHGAALGYGHAEFRQGRIEEAPVEDGWADVAISNGVMNLSFRKGKVAGEIFRILKPGGRMSIVDVVSARPLSQSIVNDPKLWAS